MREIVVPEYPTRLGGVPFIVADAHLAECAECGGQVFDAKEVRRWEQDLRAQLQARGAIVSPAGVRRVREGLGLSVAEFAVLLGVTRQTVYSWENAASGGMQLGPAALLLGFLAESLERPEAGILQYLVRSARQRGQQVKSSLADVLPATAGPSRARADAPTRSAREVPPGAPTFGGGKEVA